MRMHRVVLPQQIFAVADLTRLPDGTTNDDSRSPDIGPIAWLLRE